ncbi:MAG: hypothetical protein B6U78_00640 [Candidatus Aenigmarchaeota archaeon ex4484_224]|nr:MAG: hypothetical protein B6U78_00640 [Candidatus Aenigmarchaeota archaeon ex4484_224]
MKGIILAAGFGSRMKANIPKPLIEHEGKPIISFIIEKLKEIGIDEIGIVINPKWEDLFEEKLKEFGNLTFLYQDKPLGTYDAIYRAKEFVGNEFFIALNGDIKFNSLKNFKGLKEFAIGVFEVEDVSRYGSVKVDENGYLIGIAEKKEKGKGLANAGIYLLRKEIFEVKEKIPKRFVKHANRFEYYITDGIEELIKRGIKFKVIKVEKWMSFETKEDLEKRFEK